MEYKVKKIKSTFDISIGQFQEFEKLEKPTDEQAISIFYNIDIEIVHKLSVKTITELSQSIAEVLGKENDKHKLVRKYKGLGFEPDLENMQAGAFADAHTYAQSIETIHLFTAVLYRPIKKDIYNLFRTKEYNIKEYNGTKGIEEKAKDLPLGLFLGAQAFFLTLRKDFLSAILNRFQRSNQPQKADSNNNDLTGIGDGRSDFTRWQVEIISKLNEQQKSLYRK